MHRPRRPIRSPGCPAEHGLVALRAPSNVGPITADSTLDELLTATFTDPHGAVERASSRLDSATEQQKCVLLRVIGNAQRELRQTTESVGHLEASVELAARIGDVHLEGLAAMSLAASLSYDGDFARSITTVERAIALLSGDDQIAAMSQRAGLLQRAGRNAEALEAFTAALDIAATATDQTIRGDLWMNRGVLLGMTGDVEGAARDTQRALDLFETEGWHKRALDMGHNLAWLAGRRGDVVDALRRFDAAEAGYEHLGLTATSVFPDRCEVLISAGLSDEALAVAESAANNFAEQGNQVDAAESLMLVARAALLSADFGRASEAGAAAASSFTQQGRSGWDDAARVVTFEARLGLGNATADDRAAALAVADRLRDLGMPGQAAAASLVAAEIALELGDLEACATDLEALTGDHLGFVEDFRLDHARARLAVALDRPDDALQLCDAALRKFIDISAALGGTEIRAHIAAHVERLVDIGAALALDHGQPIDALHWAERQRSSVLTAAPVLPPQDPELERGFNLLRSAMTDLDGVRREGGDDAAALERFENAQDQVRRRSRHLGGSDRPSADNDPDLTEQVAQIEQSGDTWVVFVEVAGGLHSIRLGGGTITTRRLGALTEIEQQVEMLQSMYAIHLNALGRGRERDPAALFQAAAELDALLLPGGEFGQDQAVVCPSGSVFDLPWGLLPTLASTSFVLSPSIGAHFGTPIDRPLGSQVACVAGPDLQLADEEATAVAAIHGTDPALTGSAATADVVKQRMQQADLVHVVCHGRFASGNAMFSSLRLHDGELFVYELERLRPAPSTVVLSACNAGLHGSPARGQVLGLTTSLLAGGTRSVVAATVPVPDTVSTVALMTELHTHLRDGVGVADALRAVRATSPVVGAAFSCHGHH